MAGRSLAQDVQRGSALPASCFLHMQFARSDNIPPPASAYLITWSAHPSSVHAADPMMSDFRRHNTLVNLYFTFQVLEILRLLTVELPTSHRAKK